MQDFTQSKWEAQNWDSDRWAVFDETGITVSDCFNNQANARLIAAAPDLYRLLERFAHCIHEDDMFGMMEEAQTLLTRIDGKED